METLIKKMTDAQLEKEFKRLKKKITTDTSIDSIALDNSCKLLTKLFNEMRKRKMHV